jgi:MoaA/NifB/PqqE/SkfB family radical SAM enzyme
MTYVHPARIRVRRPYDVEGDWILFSTCNYRCAYCFWDEAALGAKIAPIAPVDTLAAYFDRTGLTWLLHLTGGEPFIYPDFVRLCRLLTRRHLISINTNADSPHVRAFVDTVDPARVDFVNCGIHERERLAHRGTDRFVANVTALRAAGFDAFASCVLHPDLVGEFPGIWQRYADAGVVVIPKAFRGAYAGRRYPAGYTAADRELFREYSARAAEFYAAQFARRDEPPTINPFMDGHLFLDELPDYRGDLCAAGRSFVRIVPDGEVRRCGPDDVVGHVLEGWFARRSQAAPCTTLECPYFCEKYRVVPPDGATGGQGRAPAAGPRSAHGEQDAAGAGVRLPAVRQPDVVEDQQVARRPIEPDGAALPGPADLDQVVQHER